MVIFYALYGAPLGNLSNGFIGTGHELNIDLYSSYK
jgi:hypothetical protein